MSYMKTCVKIIDEHYKNWKKEKSQKSQKFIIQCNNNSVR